MKPELLAPAGNFEKLKTAFYFGADAAYVGGKDFSLRSFADNFTREEMCEAVSLAHGMGKKVYVTANIFAKNADMGAMEDYFAFLQSIGVDAAIISDSGVFYAARKSAPKLDIHISTQANLTNKCAVKFWREQGATRAILARELSLKEISEIRDFVPDIELEAFVHGAMCISYSGRCLLSNYLSGRESNRGECVQACRWNYQVRKKDAISDSGWLDMEEDGRGTYILNSKDLNMSAYLNELRAAGVTSFKIEGRMKKPEYAAGVTAIYRKYMDLYYHVGAEGYRVEPEDMDRLRGLYIRSEIQTGYYERHNGKEMITLSKPGYAGSDERLLAQIREDYLHEPDKQPVCLEMEVKAGAPVRVVVSGDGQSQTQVEMTGAGQALAKIEITGCAAEPAKKAPL